MLVVVDEDEDWAIVAAGVVADAPSESMLMRRRSSINYSKFEGGVDGRWKKANRQPQRLQIRGLRGGNETPWVVIWYFGRTGFRFSRLKVPMAPKTASLNMGKQVIYYSFASLPAVCTPLLFATRDVFRCGLPTQEKRRQEREGHVCAPCCG
jgi:hypothetical protein